jgi:hypothetical protein
MTMHEAFASHADLADKPVTFTRLGRHAQADPGTGIGEAAARAADVIRRIREVSDPPTVNR